MKTVLRAVLFALLLGAKAAHADWTRMGVAVRCTNDEFAVVSTVETSSKEYNVNAPGGFHVFHEGARQHYRCTLGNAAIDMIINVYGPQASGEGQGAGVIIIDRLSVGQTTLIDKPTNFNWQVSNEERVLTEIRVTRKAGGYSVVFCYSNGWDWDAPYRDMRCETNTIAR